MVRLSDKESSFEVEIINWWIIVTIAMFVSGLIAHKFIEWSRALAARRADSLRRNAGAEMLEIAGDVDAASVISNDSGVFI